MLWTLVNCGTVSRRASMLCLHNVHALSTHQCIICCLLTKRLTCKVANRSCKDHRFPKSLVVVAERKSPNNFQGASHANSQHLICRNFLAIPQTLREMSVDSSWGVRVFFVKCLQTLHEVSADTSWITALCCTWIRGLPTRLFCGKQYITCVLYHT